MRTTLNLDDDVLELAARRAKLRGVSLGKAVSDLLRRGLSAPTPVQEKNGLVMFRLPADIVRSRTWAITGTRELHLAPVIAEFAVDEQGRQPAMPWPT